MTSNTAIKLYVCLHIQMKQPRKIKRLGSREGTRASYDGAEAYVGWLSNKVADYRVSA